MVAGWLAESFAQFARPLDAKGLDDDIIDAGPVGAHIKMMNTGDRTSARSQISREAVGLLPPLPAPLPNLVAPGRAYRPALAHDVMPRAC
jgi:hypothetical protein